jgi:hypothetical protein
MNKRHDGAESSSGGSVQPHGTVARSSGAARSAARRQRTVSAPESVNLGYPRRSAVRPPRGLAQTRGLSYRPLVADRVWPPARSSATTKSNVPAQALTGSNSSGSRSPMLFEISHVMNQMNVMSRSHNNPVSAVSLLRGLPRPGGTVEGVEGVLAAIRAGRDDEHRAVRFVHDRGGDAAVQNATYRAPPVCTDHDHAGLAG